MNINKLQLPKNWAFITLINFLISALLGFILRYTMNFPLKFVNYSYWLHAHSHFVFHAWASLALMSSFIRFLLPKEKSEKRAYGWIFWLMMFSSVGMLVTFIIQGYGFFSILFSTLAQTVFYWFIIQFIRDARDTIVNKTVKFFTFASLIALFTSTLGPYFLAYFTAKGSSFLLTQSSLYFYLHFQYNGWFFFAMLSLFYNWLFTKGKVYKESYLKWAAILFTVGVVPGFALSLIGDVQGLLVEINAYLAVITKTTALVLLFISVFRVRDKLKEILSKSVRILWQLSALALILKSVMDALLLNPELAKLAFKLRPLVIGYLHLTFLIMLSFFLLGYYFEKRQLILNNNRLSSYSFWSFILFSIISEALLFLQALSFIINIEISFLLKTIFFSTALLTLALTIFVISIIRYPGYPK